VACILAALTAGVALSTAKAVAVKTKTIQIINDNTFLIANRIQYISNAHNCILYANNKTSAQIFISLNLLINISLVKIQILAFWKTEQ
jgi:deoxyxylulose-5-phosphate synthase